MTRTVVDWCRETEAKMSAEQMSHALAIVYANGWRPGDQPPAWIWAEAFRQAIAAPQQSADSAIGS